MSERQSENPFDLPAHYRITIIGILDDRWVERRWGMTSSLVECKDEPDQTMLAGEVADQAALAGILAALYNMQRTVLSVERIHPDSDSVRNEAGEQA